MGMMKRYSNAYIVSSTTLEQAIVGFESAWLSQHWLPNDIQDNSAFAEGVFKNYPSPRCVKLRLIHPADTAVIRWKGSSVSYKEFF